jgi:hypothetical protein
MLGTYASALAVLAAGAAVGQAILSLCGRREWSWLAPATGLAALMPIAWLAVRLPGEGTAAIVAVALAVLLSLIRLRGRVQGLDAAWRAGLPVALLALAAASLPFLVEGRFGILGTGLNPDMSQHLFAADRLAADASERLAAEGYPLGPHALVVGLSALGPSLVQAFGGLTVATAVIASLSSLTLLERLPPARRAVAAILVGLAYMSAAYLIQGAFKETMQALFLLAFAVGLAQVREGRLGGAGVARAVPLAVLGLGAIYVYSFPALLWLAGAAGAWVIAELALASRSLRSPGRLAKDALRPAAFALAVLLVGAAPELGRMIDFASFETFDPDGPGLGNLFNPLSPLEALGIWPSGDFRLDPGTGFAPAAAFWLGAAVGALALGFGLWWWLRRREAAVPSALAASALIVAYAHLAGTPYQEAKAIALAAPLAMLVSVRALASAVPSAGRLGTILHRRGLAALLPRSARRSRLALALAGLSAAFAVGAGGSSLLALANGPVGPSAWGPGLLEVRPLPGATLVLASDDFLAAHGRDLAVWELRGGEVCVEPYPGPSRHRAPAGIAHVVVVGGGDEAPLAGTTAGRELGADYSLWEVEEPVPGDAGCPFISDGARAEPGQGS